MSAAVQAIRSRTQTPKPCPSSGRASGLSASSSCSGPAPSPAGSSGCRSCATRSSSSAPQKQQQRTFEVAPRRGVLYDRNLRELAMTVLVDSIYADPSEIADKQAAARTLAASGPHRSRRRAHHRSPDRRAPQRRPQLCLGRAPRHAAGRRRCQSPQHEGHLLPERVSALLSRQPDRRAGAGLRGRRRQRPRRPGRKIRRRAARRSRPHVHGHGRAPQGSRLKRARPRARPESRAHHRREHSVHGRARARSRHGKDAGSSTAPSSCRTCTPGRFWPSPFAPPSIPTSFATPRPLCCATTRSAMSTSPVRPSSWSPTPPRWTRRSPRPTT